MRARVCVRMRVLEGVCSVSMGADLRFRVSRCFFVQIGWFSVSVGERGGGR